MNTSELLELSEVIRAAATGRVVEYRMRAERNTTWRTKDPTSGLWDLRAAEYRIKPEPVTRPWSKPEDVPGPVCWIRDRFKNSAQCLIVGIAGTGLRVSQEGNYKWEEVEGMEHSTDRRTWHPCTVEEAP